MNTPCSLCPFRTDVPAYIREARGEEIWESLGRGAMFPCHKTVDYSDDEGDGRVTSTSQFCAGALILMEQEWEGQGGAMANQMVRICTRIGSPPLDLDALNMDAPVFGEVNTWFAHLGGRL